MAALPSYAAAQGELFKKYRDRGIVVAQATDMPPMSYVAPGGLPKGYIIDLWKKWSNETGIPVTFHLSQWAESLAAVRRNEADVHGGLFYTKWRDTYLDYSQPFFLTHGALLVLNECGHDGVQDLRGRKVCVLEGSLFDELIRNRYPQMEPVLMKTIEDAVMSMHRDKVDGFIGDYPTFMYQAGAMGLSRRFRVVDFVVETTFRAAVLQGNTEMLAVVDAGFDLIDEEEREAIYRRWVVGDDTEKNGWLIQAAIVTLVSLGIAILLPFLFDRLRS